MPEEVSKISILLVDDYELARNGLKFSIQSKPEQFEIVGEAENGEIAVEMVDKLNPDLILMDIAMPVMDGIEATRKIKIKSPESKVVMITSRQKKEEILATLAAGADAYCMKDISNQKLLAMLLAVNEGVFWLDSDVAKIVMDTVRPKLSAAEKKQGEKTAKREQYNTELTEREFEVIELIVEGQNNKQIAETLSISIHTVKVHVSNVIQKLAADDRTEAAVKAMRQGIVSIPVE